MKQVLLCRGGGGGGRGRGGGGENAKQDGSSDCIGGSPEEESFKLCSHTQFTLPPHAINIDGSSLCCYHDWFASLIKYICIVIREKNERHDINSRMRISQASQTFSLLDRYSVTYTSHCIEQNKGYWRNVSLYLVHLSSSYESIGNNKAFVQVCPCFIFNLLSSRNHDWFR